MAGTTDLFGPEWQLPALIARTGYANELSANVAGVLDAAYQDVTAKLLTANLTPAARAELEAFRLFVSDRLNEAFGLAKGMAEQSLAAYGAVEAGVAAGQVNTVLAALGRPSRQQILSAAEFPKIVAGLDLNGVGFGEWWQASAVNYAQKVQRTVQTGLLRGLNPKAIARQITGDPKAPAAPSIAKNSAAWTRMTVRTAMTAVQTHAAVEEYKALTTGAMLGVRFEAILDYRTSDVCRAFDNRVYALDDKALPRPPLHPNCRSTLVPVVDTTGAGIWQKNVDPGAKRLTAEQWMTKQPAGVQNALLGPKRAQLYRDGKVSLAELVGKDKRRLTLAQLDQYLTGKAAGLVQPPTAPPMPKSQYKAPKTPKAAKAAQTAGPLPSPLSAPTSPASGAAAAAVGTGAPVAPVTDAIADVVAAANPGAVADEFAKYRAWRPNETPVTRGGAKVAGQGGSNEGGRYIGLDGVDRYVKVYPDAEQAYSEILASRLFRDLGAAAPDFEIAAVPGGRVAVASKWVDGAKNLGLAPSKEDARAVLDHIVGDIFTANWDAVGLNGDNILKLADGRLYRVDVGGSFFYRADAKKGLKFTADPLFAPGRITEWEVFATKNAQYRAMWDRSGLTPDLYDVGPQVAKIIDLRRKYAFGKEGWERYLDGVMGDANAFVSPEARAKLVDFLFEREQALKVFSAEQRARVIATMEKRGDWNARMWLDANKGKKVGESLDAIPPVGGIAPPVPVSPYHGPQPDPLRVAPDPHGPGGVAERWSDQHARFKQQWQDFVSDSLTAPERTGITAYTGNEYRQMATVLRDGQSPSVGLARKISGVDKAMAKSPGLKENAILYRGMKSGDAMHGLLRDVMANATSEADLVDRLNALIGRKVTDKGFMSTSLWMDVADRFDDTIYNVPSSLRLKSPVGTKTPSSVEPFYEIEGKAGDRGVYVALYDKQYKKVSALGESEYEFMYDRDTTFEVLGWRWAEFQGRPRLVLRVQTSQGPRTAWKAPKP